MVFNILTASLMCLLLVIMTTPLQNRADKQGKHEFKNRTRLLMVAGQFVSLACVFLSFPAKSHSIGMLYVSPVFNLCGMAAMLAGLTIRIIAMLQLGKFYTPLLFVNNDQPLVTRGLYRLIRHPVYLGDLVFFCAVGFSLANYLVILIECTIMVPSYLIRIAGEEKMMVSAMGKEYRDYMAETRKLIPFIF